MTLTRLAAGCLALALSAAPLAGQAVLDDPVLDSVQTEVRDALYRLRDTLTTVDAATSRIARDIRSASDQVLRSRARVVAERCAAAAGTLPPIRELVGASNLPAHDRLKLRPRLVTALSTLEGQLTQCATEFTGLTAPAKAEELRGYGIGKGERLQARIREYQLSVVAYFKEALGIRYLPNSGATAGRATSGNPGS